MADLISREALERRCKGSYLTPDDFRFEIRNAPAIPTQQPQEQAKLVKKAVADALEEVAKEIDLIVNTYIESGNKYHEVSEGRERCVNKARAAMSCAETIRAIVKRNAEKG